MTYKMTQGDADDLVEFLRWLSWMGCTHEKISKDWAYDIVRQYNDTFYKLPPDERIALLEVKMD